MTPQEENELIATWAGIECRCECWDTQGVPCDLTIYKIETDNQVLPVGNEHRIYADCPRHSNNGLPPDYDRDEVAVELLNKIPNWLLDKTPDEGVQLSIYGTFGPPIIIGEWQPTIATAIKAAVLQLIEKENTQ